MTRGKISGMVAEAPERRRGRPKKLGAAHIPMQIRVPVDLCEAISAICEEKRLMTNCDGARELMRAGAEALGLIDPRK